MDCPTLHGRCLQCGEAERLCSHTWSKAAAAPAPELLKIPETHVTYRQVCKIFYGGWTGWAPAPPISSIYRIIWTADLHSSFAYYRDMVQSMTGCTDSTRFRSEKRACNLGEPGSLELCQWPDCHLCKAIRTGFQSSLEYKRSIRGPKGINLGRGIYTTPSSYKAYQYAVNIGSADGSNMKAVLSTQVVLGYPFNTNRKDPRIVAPPPGYHSVIGVPGVPGCCSDFSDPEEVVYDKDAIRPTYLIMLKDSADATA
ncbi:hypothetical protein C8F04DRAFT_956592 [Mycena alexandri]|uniref:PARP catalytic domain-containing protein n=1 Tax=Mycena alexandri TaxID=1745969 RepID=A0AAD6X498_9AGAR|nr:hypothetical protein C8F04DRAFT_956592 [Mycena alexandri]